mgnify:CR=1 FL=1
MDPAKVKKYVARLQAERERLAKEIERLERTGIGDNMADSLGELSVYDNHPADIGSELFERAKDLGLQDNARLLLQKVEHALAKVQDGSYGRCDQCGGLIGEERLEAVPWADKCIKCQRQEDQREAVARPIEEALLSPPFKRTFLDHSPTEFVGFGGEDAWQAVGRYGSAESPQDIFRAKDYKNLVVNSDEHAGIVDLADAIPNPETNLAKDKKRKPSS